MNVWCLCLSKEGVAFVPYTQRRKYGQVPLMVPSCSLLLLYTVLISVRLLSIVKSATQI